MISVGLEEVFGGETALAEWLQCLAPKREVAGLSLRWIPKSELAWSLYKCATLWRVVYGPSATERLLETICEENFSLVLGFFLVAI